MANVVRILITAKDEISGSLDRIRDKATMLSKTDIGKGLMQGAGIAAFNMVKGAAFAALGAVEDFASGSVQAAREEEAGIARLTASLTANVKGWDRNTAAIERTVEAQQRKGFADDAVRDSLTRLVGATHDIDKAFAIQQTAMDLARFKGIDLATATDALIKVEGGQYRALKSLGIVLRDGATQTEALAAVQKVAGGQAAAYMETSAGKADLLAQKMDNLQEIVGAKLLPVLDGITSWASSDGVPALETLIKALELLGSMFDQDSEQTKDFQRQAQETGWYWQATGETIVEASHDSGDAIKFLARSAVESEKHLSDSAGWMSHAMLDVGSAAVDARRTVEDALQGIVDAAKTTKDELAELGQQAASALYDPIIDRANLTANEQEQAAQRAVIASKTATDEEVANAKLRLAELGAANVELRAQMLAAGELSKAEQEKFLADLQAAWTTSTGEARAAIGLLIAKIKELQNKSTVDIAILAGGGLATIFGKRAAGGPLAPYQTAVVGENGPELIRMGASGGMVSPSLGGAQGGGGTPVVVQLSLDGRVVAEVVDRHLYYQAARAPQSAYAS